MKRGKPMKRSRIKAKSSKRKQKQALDLELKQLIHERDGFRCVVPELYGPHGGCLQAAHIHSKGHWPKLRHVPDNLISMCWRHHFHWAHKEPIEFTDWIRETYPDRMINLAKLKGI